MFASWMICRYRQIHRHKVVVVLIRGVQKVAYPIVFTEKKIVYLLVNTRGGQGHIQKGWGGGGLQN